MSRCLPCSPYRQNGARSRSPPAAGTWQEDTMPTGTGCAGQSKDLPALCPTGLQGHWAARSQPLLGTARGLQQQLLNTSVLWLPQQPRHLGSGSSTSRGSSLDTRTSIPQEKALRSFPVSPTSPTPLCSIPDTPAPVPRRRCAPPVAPLALHRRRRDPAPSPSPSHSNVRSQFPAAPSPIPIPAPTSSSTVPPLLVCSVSLLRLLMVGCRGGGWCRLLRSSAGPGRGAGGVPRCWCAGAVRGGAALPSRITYGVPGRRRC